MKLKDIATTQRNIEEGAWVSNLPNLPGVSVKVRGMFNSDAARLLAEAKTTLSPEEWADKDVQDRLDVKIVHETILLDWAGIDDQPYDRDTALLLLQDPDYAIFRRAVNYAASVVAQEGRATLEEAAKN